MRLFKILGVASLAMTLASVEANATVFIGSTEGCFGASCSVQTNASDHNLSFTGTSIDLTNPTLPTGVTLGSFTLQDSSLFGGHIFNNETFDLQVTFTTPSGTADYSADVKGFITVLGGLVSIDFSPSSLASFGSNPTYVLDVNNLVLGTSFLTGGKETELLTGTISGPAMTSAVPETSTWVMMIIGLASLGLFGRRSGAFRGAMASA